MYAHFSLFIARNVDYTAVNDEVVFTVGEYVKNITIPILSDLEREEEEIFFVELVSECCADIVNQRVQVRIVDGMCINLVFASEALYILLI